ncbi:MAG TPA: hypothetical protein VGQ27_07155 [Steroidobacteraceae bacterium]|jgi:hypothetical protein|nr:hypothetical protein [Steroidobacteraceae bacterium]
MIGRRSAALLCVLLAHAWVVYLLLQLQPAVPSREAGEEFTSEPITLELVEATPFEPAPPASAAPHPASHRAAPAPAAAASATPSTGAAAAIPAVPQGYVDWPLEGKQAAQREVAREMEAERIAKMFAGPQGTWASLTKRQRSKLNKFRWRPGVLGMEYDEKGNQIYHLSDGCVIVNGGVIACALGKVKVHGDMFENMRQYFDEQRLPETADGNGTEPEALRPAN